MLRPFHDIVHTVFRNCGWKVKGNVYGRPILLSDLWDTVEEVGTSLEPRAPRPQDGPDLSLLSCALRGEGLVYHGTYMRRSFMKTISEGLVVMIIFENVTSIHHITVRIEDEIFEEWSCVSCRNLLYNEDMKESL